MTSLALVVGVGSGLSAAIARALAQRSYRLIDLGSPKYKQAGCSVRRD